MFGKRSPIAHSDGSHHAAPLIRFADDMPGLASPASVVSLGGAASPLRLPSEEAFRRPPRFTQRPAHVQLPPVRCHENIQ